ncbi:glycylpeptide N-tetradecanoyltransferase [Serendipita sp. 401]|nr:glycylpeptide N-tetradecanoyltransferase [Serendipita sp. 400]KAG8821264.1 glycylpeptide N-tetradecanoyltransferase [Serendipita sp. 401]
MSARIEEIKDEDEEKQQQEEEEQSDDELPPNDENVAAAEPSSSATTSKGKKQKKKKKAKGNKGANDIPQEVVDHVVSEIRQKHGASTTENLDEAHVRMALDRLRILDVLKGKAGIGGKNRKEMGEHKFWATQPVPQLGEGIPDEDGAIEISKPSSEVRQAAYPLPKEFEWVVVDITDDSELKELYELLSANYVEDDDAAFRFNYSAEFLRWALMPPDWIREWHVGVRVASKKAEPNETAPVKGRLVAFISAVPVKLRVRKK